MDFNLLNIHNIYLLRHGKTEGPPALNGSTDVPVAMDVQEQIAERLSNCDVSYSRIITSPLQRCRQLADMLATRNPVLKVDLEPDLRELHFGLYDGRSFDQLEEQREVLEAFWENPAANPLPDAETLDQAYRRMTAAWDRCLNTVNQDILIITHGGTIRLLIAHILNIGWDNPNLFYRLSIGYQSLTHVNFYKNEKLCVLKSIGAEL